MEIVKQNKKATAKAIRVLKNGGLVIFPCETVYGVAVDALNPEAVICLNKYKQRPLGKPYAIMVAGESMAEKYVELNSKARNLYREFLPGPLTVVSTGKHKLAPGIESETGSLGVRIPDYPFMLDLIKEFGHPIVATSANASYQKRPYQIADILDNLSNKQKGLIDLIIDAGKLPPNEPSTVIDTTLDNPVVLRQGGLKFKAKNEILSRNEEATQNFGKELWQKYEKYLGKRPLIFALEGPMGAGKTQLTKGLGKAMGISDEIISPTFNLVLEYHTKNGVIDLNHIDAWRLQDPKEFGGLGFIKMLEKKNMVIAIEWAERVANAIRVHRDQATIIWIKIRYGKADNERLIGWGAL
jgi:L-threonylcarbamoyladenylate synthase